MIRNKNGRKRKDLFTTIQLVTLVYVTAKNLLKKIKMERIKGGVFWSFPRGNIKKRDTKEKFKNGSRP